MLAIVYSSALFIAQCSTWTITPGIGHCARFASIPKNNFGIARNVTYDHVIVGGGTAGLAVACRLAVDGTKSVAVVEAGGLPQLNDGNTWVIAAYYPLYGAITEESVLGFDSL
ncbi:uncharacterized protein K489DRAFT_398180 [Dissoconium aciculare CBS 342.82]|uniref:FAD-dependent oxidoreductase 2 FAD-binding domain-containing protein n=1 Tax=Dissoconium aciculare CBS 342.82 TaxID=1314786 RepID=A0A6J3MDV1_9PEZI|nr:uncharacterized protein K489DRAFT_398180 [Dissoconium aciculare CBS 342.82]KAF1825784.1 hypothetical protein K489DRAFT_398180 [Dissoconium aciculare CBS 342.82]